MPRQRSPNRDKAKVIYLKSHGKAKLKDIAAELGVLDTQIRKWKNQDKWDEELKGTLPNKSAKLNSNVTKRKKGGQPGNKNSERHGAPIGNLNSLKHGAHQTLYEEMLSYEEKDLYEKTTADINIDSEIRLLRLKIARLLNRNNTFFYDMFGKKYKKDISEEDRENGILACMDQLRRLIETKATIAGDSEKISIDREKLEFSKYKTKIELQLKKEKLELEKSKVMGTDEEVGDDGFLEALKGQISEVWDNE